MPADADRPFGPNTLKLRAAFVPEDQKHNFSRQHMLPALGSDVVKFSAALVREGSDAARPGYPYVRIGQYQFHRDADQQVQRGLGSWVQQPSQAEPDPDGEGGETRSPPPPVPALARGQRDPLAAGVAAWRRVANPAAAWRQRKAALQAAAGPQAPRGVRAAASPAPASSNPNETRHCDESGTRPADT